MKIARQKIKQRFSRQANCHSQTNTHDSGFTKTSGQKIALVGHPNVGKSVLFKRLTGHFVMVSNYPGTTVEVTRAAAQTLPETIIVDTPGVVSIPAHSEDEAVTVRVLLDEQVHNIIQVGDSKNLRRTLLLTVQLAELGIPMVVVLNMIDEAERHAVKIDHHQLQQQLGVTVFPTVATQSVGVDALAQALPTKQRSTLHVCYPKAIEKTLQRLEPLLPEHPIRKRALGLLWLGADKTTETWLANSVDTQSLSQLQEARSHCHKELQTPVAAAIQKARIATANLLAAAVLQVDKPREQKFSFAKLTTHRFWCWPILVAVLYLLYLFVGVFGAGTLVNFVEKTVFAKQINPWVSEQVHSLIPVELIRDFIVGPYGLWTMGMTYALALVLPIVTTFFLAFSTLEDTGYLARLTVVGNRFFKMMGLNGKAVLPMVLGLGCVTMATLTTRILDSKRDRILTIFLLALAVPCSAQLGVVLGMLGSVSLTATLIWAAVVLFVLLTVGVLAARLIPGERSTLLIELPPLRRPMVANVITKTLARLEWYIKEVVPIFLAGTAALFILDKVGALPAITDFGKPIVTSWLGLPSQASTAFLIGFLRRDFGATGLFVLSSNGSLSPEQIVVAMVTITLFIPCIASVMMIARERGTRTAVAMTLFIFPFAFFIGGLLHRILLLAGWGA